MTARGLWIVFCLVVAVALPASSGEADRLDERRALVEEVRKMGRLDREGVPDLDAAVLAALERVPRHLFVPEDERDDAYENRPLPIGHGQTISQPYIVALMTDLLDLPEGGRVLEVGTGSGYQAAVLAEVGAEVFTIEIIEALGKQVAERLAALGYGAVKTRIGDGYYGWKEAAPFDAVIVTAAASHIPPPLVRQLKIGGRMVIPVGNPFQIQYLTLVIRETEETATVRQLLAVSFVPLTGER